MAFKLIDPELYADNGDGSYSGVKWRDMKSATLECKCNEADREKIKQLLLGENHYREKPRIDIPSKEDISDQIYKLLSFHNQDLSEFGVSVMAYKNPIDNFLKLTILLTNDAYKTENAASMLIFDDTTQEEIKAILRENLDALVMKCVGEIKTKSKFNIKKENDIMVQYQYANGGFEAIKTQEEIELEEKITKLRAEYDKKVVKLREEYKAAKEKKERDAKAKELHDKYQSLIDAGFSEDEAYNILQIKMKSGEF